MHSSFNYIYHIVDFIPSIYLPYNRVFVPLVTANLISFSMNLFDFWSVIDRQHFVSSCYTTQWFNISMHSKMITMVDLVTICYHIKSLLTYWLCSPLLCTSYPWVIYFVTESSYLNLPHLFLSFPSAPGLWQPPSCSLYLWLCFTWFYF